MAADAASATPRADEAGTGEPRGAKIGAAAGTSASGLAAQIEASLALLGKPDPYGYGIPSPRLVPVSADDAHAVGAYVRELIGVRAQLPRDRAVAIGDVRALSEAIERAAASAKAVAATRAAMRG